jgi:hypothetical protein
MWNKFYIQYSINNYKRLVNNNKFSWLKLNKIKSSSIDENNYLSQMAYLHSYNYDKLESDYDKNIYNNEDDFLYKMSIIHSRK